MLVSLVHDFFEPAHLEQVKKEMLELGAPTIRVIDCCDYYSAVEGCHRLRAAKALGLVPKFVVIDIDDDLSNGLDSLMSEIPGLDLDNGDDSTVDWFLSDATRRALIEFIEE